MWSWATCSMSKGDRQDDLQRCVSTSTIWWFYKAHEDETIVQFVQWTKCISCLIDFQTLYFWGIKYVTLRNMTSNWESRSKGHTYQITSKWQDVEAGINGLKFFLARSHETMKEIEESTGVSYSSAQGQPRSLVWTVKIYMCLQQPSGHKLFFIMVCATDLYCHLTKVWVVSDFFSLAQGVHILTVSELQLPMV